MTDTVMAIIGIVIAVLIMFIFPVVAIASQHDEIAQATVEAVVADFVNTISEKGKITEFDYNALIQKIHATGNTFDVQIEVQLIDDNPERKTVTTSADSSIRGENLYYSVYTENITQKLRSELAKDREYNLKKDDYVIVTVKNTNISIGTQFKNFFYKLIGKDTYTIGASSAALVANSGDEEMLEGTSKEGDIVEHPAPISKEVTVYITNTQKISSNVTFVIDITGSMGSTTGATGYANRMDMVRKNVKSFLQSLDMPDTDKRENTIINVIRFGTASDIMTNPDGINTQNELNALLNGDYDSKLYEYIPEFQNWENYDLGLEDALTCVRRNKTINSKPNVVIVITDGNHIYNSSYCEAHGGNMSEYAQKLINVEGATVYAVGIQTSTDVLDSMVLDTSKYCKQIYDNVGLTSLLNEVKSEITTEEQRKLVSVDGKILLTDLEEISSNNKLTIKITGPVNTQIEITNEHDTLIEKDETGYWLVLTSLAVRLGGLDVLDESNIELHY